MLIIHIFMICYSADDIQVLFSDGEWEAVAEFSSNDIHQRVWQLLPMATIFQKPLIYLSACTI